MMHSEPIGHRVITNQKRPQVRFTNPKGLSRPDPLVKAASVLHLQKTVSSGLNSHTHSSTVPNNSKKSGKTKERQAAAERDVEMSGTSEQAGRSRRQSRSGQVLVPNTPGRIVFLALGVLLIVTAVLSIMVVVQGAVAWQVKVSIVLQLLGMLLVIFAGTSATVFRFRWTNFAVFSGLTVGVVVMEVLLSGDKKAAGLALAHTSNLGGALLLLVAGLLLVIPSSAAIAHNIQPFVLSGRRRKTSKTPSTPPGKEVHSVFEDWPDPIPFPVTTLYTFATTSQSELPFTKGQNLIVLDCRGNWWQAKDPASATVGFVPSNFVQVLQKARVVQRHLAASEDEATVQEGQLVEVMEHHEFLSLVRTVEGRIGSVPTSCLELISDAQLEKLKA